MADVGDDPSGLAPPEVPGGNDQEEFVEGLYLGDAIRFFLDTKRAGGRSERTLSEYRKKLDLFQRWAAGRLSREDDAVDAPVWWVGPDEVEAYDGASARARTFRHLAQEPPLGDPQLL